jgi:hypothetical protein
VTSFEKQSKQAEQSKQAKQPAQNYTQQCENTTEKEGMPA